MSGAALACALCVGVSSCGSTKGMTAGRAEVKSAPQRNKEKDRRKSAPTPKVHIDVAKVSEHAVTRTLLAEADSWIGTPYAWGGNDRKGVDCSGFVTQVYLRSLQISLPRTSETQMKYCKPIDRKDLVPGDLVFFTVRGGNRVGHVGIYIGDGNMVHSSSSKGVVVTPLDNPYFVANYYSSGRVERYFAMLDDNGAKKDSRGPETPKPLLASKEKPTAAPATTPKPKAKPKPKVKPESKSKPDARSADDKPVFSTPMPDQVFASRKTTVVEVADDEETPDFFD